MSSLRLQNNLKLGMGFSQFYLENIIYKSHMGHMKEDNGAVSSISNKQKTKRMKPKPGTAKPSGKIGKGSPATSPTDGKSLKVKGGKKKK